MRDNDWTRVLGWPAYKVYRHEIDERGKKLKLWMRRKRANKQLMRSGCGMLVGNIATSERSFGRSLLFLKDQIKDLRASHHDLSREAASLSEQVAAIDGAILSRREERERAVKASPQADAMVTGLRVSWACSVPSTSRCFG